MVDVPRDFLAENVNRYRQLIGGQTPDYAPFRLWLDDTFVCSFTGVDPKRYFADFEVMFGAQRAINERFCDLREYTVDVNTLDLFFDRQKFQAEYPNAPSDRFLHASLDDFERFYTTRPIDQTPGVKRLMKGIDFFNARLPKDRQIGHYLGVFGAMDLFSIFRGTERFFLDLYDNPQAVRRIFDYLHERSMAWLEFEQATWGGVGREHSILFDKVDIGEDYCAYLPPELFDEFVVPYTGDIFSHFKGKVLCSLHTDGDVIPRGIGKLGELGLDELMGFSPNMDIREFRAALPDVILGGNIHPIHVMIQGSPQDVKDAARHCFQNGRQRGRFVLCTGGAIGAGAKPENVDAFIEAAYEIVKY